MSPCCCVIRKPIRVCGFKHYLNASVHNPHPETRYGDCNTNRLYVCKIDDASPWTVSSASYDLAHCKFRLSGSWTPAQSGYYWVNETYSFCHRDFSKSDGILDSYQRCIRVSSSGEPSILQASNGATTVSPFKSNDERIKEQELTGNKNLGLKVGVPVAVCLVIFCGAAIVAYAYCRFRRTGEQSTTEDKSVEYQTRSASRCEETITGKCEDTRKRSQHNLAYEFTEENEYNYVSVDDNKDTSREVTRSLEQSKNYSFATETNENEYSTQCQEHVYDHNFGEYDKYDSAAGRKHPHDMHGEDYSRIHVGVDATVDVYDTTIKDKPLNQPKDNVYNTLSINSDANEEYDTTSTVFQHPTVVDDTYSRLK